MAGEKLRISLLEVKRKDEMPGDQTRRAMTINQDSTRQAINKALKQLETNVEMIQVTFCLFDTCIKIPFLGLACRRVPVPH